MLSEKPRGKRPVKMKACWLEWQKAVPKLGLSHWDQIRQCQINSLCSRKDGTCYSTPGSEGVLDFGASLIFSVWFFPFLCLPRPWWAVTLCPWKKLFLNTFLLTLLLKMSWCSTQVYFFLAPFQDSEFHNIKICLRSYHTMNQQVFQKFKFCLEANLTPKVSHQPTPLPGLIVLSKNSGLKDESPFQTVCSLLATPSFPNQ